MPIAPITGKLRKGLWVNLSVALGLGVTFGYAFWYGLHLKHVQKQEEFYVKYEKQKQEAA